MSYLRGAFFLIVRSLHVMPCVLLLACSPPPPPPTAGPTPGSPAWSEDLDNLKPEDRILSISPDEVGLCDQELRFDQDVASKILISDEPPSSEFVLKAQDRNEIAIDKAIQYLIAQQSEDGGIKSKAYGVLRPGAATTALALYACGHAPAKQIEPHRQSLQQAQSFLTLGLREHGRLCAPDGTLDYPTYGAALLLIAADRLKLELSAEDRQRLTQWIIDAQLTEQHEISKESIQFGGWDLEATSGAKGDQLKGSNISITSFALEALHGSMHKDAAEAVERARGWVSRCQNEDGGFVFHVWRAHPGNKAMWTDDTQSEAISYATPTCDGLRCLMYCGATKDDQSVQRATKWLTTHPDVKFVSGFEEEAAKYGWREGLRFYYYLTQAKSLRYLPEAEARRRAIALCKLLIAEQQSDGSFKNAQPRMFEDDPILATSLALAALAVASDFAQQHAENDSAASE